MPLKVVCDFDGTISTEDATDKILMLFAAPAWEVLEASLEAGELEAAECMRRQIELVDASLPELDAALDAIAFDPAFPAFCKFCDCKGIEISVVSDGVDYFIRRILRRAGLSRLKVYANRMIKKGERQFSLAHPHKLRDCEAGTCKCARASNHSGRTVLIGDGRSDFCVSQKADIVFAKRRLLAYTKEQGIPAFEFATFADVQAVLQTLLAAPKPAPAFLSRGLNASL